MTGRMFPFKAVIFDMDGVLLDSEPLHYDALRAVLGEEGHEWSREDNERLLGTTVVDSFRIIAETVPLGRPLDAYIPIYNRQVMQVLRGPLTPAPGVLALLSDFKRLAVRMAVASSSMREWVEATISSLGLTGYFDIIVSGDEIAEGKPAPEIYLKTADGLGLDPSDCIAIEDAPNGVIAAKRAATTVLAVRTPYTEGLPLTEADAIVSSLEMVRAVASREGLSLLVDDVGG